MKKEGIKSVTLIILILCAIYLTTQIWFNKKLWPSGYNFFNSYTRIPIISDIINNFADQDKLSMNSFENLMMPYQLIVSGSDNTREVYVNDTEGYGEINNTAYKLMDVLFTSTAPKYITLSEGEWLQSIRGKSIIMDYGAVIPTRLAASARSVTDSAFSGIVNSFSEIVMIPDDYEEKAVSVYIRDRFNNKFYKFFAEYKNIELRTAIDKYAGRERGRYAFSFELNLNKLQNAEMTEGRRYLDAMVLLPMGRMSEMPVLNVSNPFDLKNQMQLYEKMALPFDMQPSNLRKSIHSDGRISYIENDATIIISPEGRLEYKAVNQKGGVAAKTLNEKISMMLNIARSEWELFLPQQSLNLRVNSIFDNGNPGVVIITMDYMAGGVHVILNPETSKGYSNAVVAKFEGDRLAEYTMLIRSMELGEEKRETVPASEALDRIYEKSNPGQEIERVFGCYVIGEESGESESYRDWAAIHNGKIYTSSH